MPSSSATVMCVVDWLGRLTAALPAGGAAPRAAGGTVAFAAVWPIAARREAAKPSDSSVATGTSLKEGSPR
jgi:hypothetical protein